MSNVMKIAIPLVVVIATLAAVDITVAGSHNDPKAGTENAAAPVTPVAQDTAVSLEGIELGTHVYGPQITSEDLAGKAVVFEYWGDLCSPCIRAIPHLTELQNDHADKLQIVANQVWTPNLEAAKKAWTNAGGSDKVAVINHGVLKNAKDKIKGVPHSFVFDAQGKLIWDGHPLAEEFDAAVKAAVATAGEGQG